MGEIDLDHALFHRDLDAEAAELAGGILLHVLEHFWVEIARMRIERRQHAVDGGAQQRLLVGCIDIFAADAVEHFAEEAQIPVDLLVGPRRAQRFGAARPRHRASGR